LFWNSTMRPDNSSSPTKSTAAGFRNIKYFPTSMPMRMPSQSSRSSWKMKAGNATILCRNPLSHLPRNLDETVDSRPYFYLRVDFHAERRHTEHSNDRLRRDFFHAKRNGNGQRRAAHS